jgi:predicted membrane protein
MSSTFDFRRSAPTVVLGLLFLTFGVLALLHTTGVVDAAAWRTYWPAALVIGGLAIAVAPGSRVVGLVIAGVGLVLLGGRLYGWPVRIWMLWPIIPILIGLKLIFRPGAGRRRATRGATPGAASSRVWNGPATGEPGVDPMSRIHDSAIFAGISRRNISQAFQGGQATAVFGGVELDLRECRMAGDETTIDVFAMFGGIELRVPKNWTIESRLSAVLGGIDDQSDPPVEGATHRLVLTGQAIFGGVEIKN